LDAGLVMTQTPSPHYVITAKTQDGIVQQTRTMAGSAMALARSWNERGYINVQVLSPSGDPLCPERYRDSILAGERPLR
jgi:hypothetical protein